MNQLVDILMLRRKRTGLLGALDRLSEFFGFMGPQGNIFNEIQYAIER